jgi:pimeloyl-ACP methyl ester carboxylesterase
MMKLILPIILAVCAVPLSSSGSQRSVPTCPDVETLSVGFNEETLKGFCLYVDARTPEEKAADAERGRPAGPVIVFYQGHAQRPDDAYEFTGSLARMSRSGMVVIPVCDTPYGADPSFRGDSGKDVILMEMVRFVLARQGLAVEGFVPATDLPITVNGTAVMKDQAAPLTRLAVIGWSHGGILARRAAHAYKGSVRALGQVCPAGYEHWGAWGLTGRFAYESLRITARMGSGHAGQTMGSAWGFTRGFTGDFFRSIPAAVADLRPAKITRVFRDIRECSRYCDSDSFKTSHLERIAVIFGQDDSCMSPVRQLGIRDPAHATEEDRLRFSRTFFADSPEGRPALRVLPGTHLAPVIHSDLYAKTVLTDLGELLDH